MATSEAKALRYIRFTMVLLFCILTVPKTLLSQEPLEVFILAGQSNMQGHAHVRTLQHLAMDPKTEGLLNEIQTKSGEPRPVENVWISYLTSSGIKSGKLTTGYGANESKIGPELSFGITMSKILKQPILIIKTAWGGKSLHTDFRPPSAGPYEFTEEQIEQLRKRSQDAEAKKAEKVEATGHYYRLMTEHVQQVLANIKDVYPNYNAEQGYEVAGFVWFQGWNDMVDRGVYPKRDQTGGYDAYSKVLSHFIRDVRSELKAPDLRFVIGVMGVNGPTADYGEDQLRYRNVHQNFRNAMAAPANTDEFKDSVFNVFTEEFWDPQLSSLRKREQKLNREAKKQIAEREQQGELTREQERELRQKLRGEAFTKEEQRILEVGVSNAEYHYLGSAKIMTQIGQAFAEALR